MDFPVILIVVIIWLFIGLPLSKLNKAAKQQVKRTANPAEKVPSGTNPPEGTGTAPAAQPGLQPARPTVLAPSISLTEHDDSVYRGSMNTETGEGYDPCHDEQLKPLTLAETAVPAAETAEPGLQLSWTGSDIVRGFVMSEILKRK